MREVREVVTICCCPEVPMEVPLRFLAVGTTCLKLPMAQWLRVDWVLQAPGGLQEHREKNFHKVLKEVPKAVMAMWQNCRMVPMVVL